MRITLDTNVILSGLAKEHSAPGRILHLWRQGEVELLVSPATLDELARVFTYLKIRRWLSVTEEEVQAILALFRAQATLIDPPSVLPDVSPDPKDNMFLAVAAAGQARYIVTGDKRHLLALESYQGIPILSPASFLTCYQQVC